MTTLTFTGFSQLRTHRHVGAIEMLQGMPSGIQVSFQNGTSVFLYPMLWLPAPSERPRYSRAFQMALNGIQATELTPYCSFGV